MIIRKNINSDTYDALLGGIIGQAVKDLQRAYRRLIKETTRYNYNHYISIRLFFDKNCNGYLSEELAGYIKEQAISIEIKEKKYSKEDVERVNKYIEEMDEKYLKNS
jgi:hypothetical protein